ncbi:universal stress protein [Pontibacter sp. KCTC 32443]|uniref:universal stress protein n=1 Tax=Pontibacter TaxID=323449 RepID=UPI00164D79FA|nr:MULTISPECIES: universal stress protein [Pontibacter]MBC5772803.1 universal stress protein [Pontibacter sp. KCTC 32443]
MRRILVPTDFSEQAQYAFEVAVNIARRTGAAIKLLHVIDMPRSIGFSATGDVTYHDNMEQLYIVRLLESTKSRMSLLLNKVNHSGVEVVQEVDVDSIVGKIKRVVADDKVDLIVMGSKGSSGMDEFLIGSNTEKVVRTANCPVLTIKRHQPDFEIKEIVLASDFRREVGKAMDSFKFFQQLFDARVHLVYINTPGAFESSTNLRSKLAHAAEKYDLRNYTINVYNDTIEEDGILHFAEDINADMIMMATHGRTGLSHLLSGSIAEDLVNHTSRPVLTYHI